MTAVTLRPSRPPLGRAALVYPALRVLALTLLVLIVVLSVASDPGDVAHGGAFGDWLSARLFGTPAYGDKFAHAAAYAALTFTSQLAWGRHRTAALTVAITAVAIGGALELIQGWGGVRSADPLDMIANMIGVGLGAGAGVAARLLVRAAGMSPA